MRRLRPAASASACSTLILAIAWVCVPATAPRAFGHDVPNAQVDRATQITIHPGRLQVDYEVSLAELTLTQELRSLIGGLPGAGRDEWFAAYGAETGPLNAKGFLVTLDGAERSLQCVGFDLVVEGHPRYTFHFEAELPPRGDLKVQDTNFTSSEGTSRLALRGSGVRLIGTDLPTDVAAVPPRPLWQLTDAEERDTRVAEVQFEPLLPTSGEVRAVESAPVVPEPVERSERSTLIGLLEGNVTRSAFPLALLAVVLGAAHALLPGHGKTLVVAATLAEDGHWWRGVALATVTALTHLGSVLLVALGLWWSRSTRYPSWDDAIGRSAGFLIAAVAVWRLGRWFAGRPIQDHANRAVAARSFGDVLALGVAGGAVPCWDAVALVLFGEAVGRLGLAVVLVLAFSVGVGAVLSTFAYVAARFRSALPDGDGAWSRRLGLASGLVLSALGLYLLYRPG